MSLPVLQTVFELVFETVTRLVHPSTVPAALSFETALRNKFSDFGSDLWGEDLKNMEKEERDLLKLIKTEKVNLPLCSVPP